MNFLKSVRTCNVVSLFLNFIWTFTLRVHSVAFTPLRKKEHPRNVWFFPIFSTHILIKLPFTRLVALHRFFPTPRNASSSSIMTTQRTTSFSFPSQVANLNGKLTATQTTLTTRDQELREKETEVGNVFETRKAVLTVRRRSRPSYFIHYTTPWEFLQFDWLRAVVFQLNLKYLHVKITKPLAGSSINN